MKRFALITVVLLAGCGSGSGYGGGGNSGPTQPTTRGDAVAAKKTDLGSVLVDGSGRTLYVFAGDKTGQSRCTGACANAWPPSPASPQPKAGSGVSKAKLTTTQRPGGQRQLVYAGHPLYRFSGDSSPGDTKGQGLNEFGGTWSAVSVTGTAVKSKPSGGSGSGGGSSSSSGGSSGGGYGGY
jgi:predicted lipoprotein with Yx(FWY)xxD motif